MARRTTGLLDRFLFHASLARWTRSARTAGAADLATLRRERQKARKLRLRLNEVLATAESRLALPRIGSAVFPRPGGTDWSWRPNLWRIPLDTPGASGVESRTRLGDEVTLFHDCTIPELTLRQIRNRHEHDLAPFGLRLDVFRFDGSFLSVVVDLPPAACAGLKRRHLIRLETRVERERPLGILARLNIRHGPNTEQIVRSLAPTDPDVFVEFDLAYTGLNEKRVERMWVDLIFENPQMNQITLRDLTFARAPRAEL